MKTVVMSLGGSIIIPDEINYVFINEFKDLIKKLSKRMKFVIIIGGGSTARKYINPLLKEGLSNKEACLMGIGITRLNARFMANFVGKPAAKHLPSSMKELKNMLAKDPVVFTGGLRFVPDNTSDGTAAMIASFLKTDLINMTNVKGLYTKDPNKFKDAKFIPKISFEDFNKIVGKIKYHAGQHFVLDQHASKTIKEHKIKTVIIGSDLKNFENYLLGKKFVGTVIG